MATTFDAIVSNNGNPPLVWIAEIKHVIIDGAHTFTSEKIPGLLVSSLSAKKAVEQLPCVISELVKSNLGFECTVQLGAHDMKTADQPDSAV